MVIKLFEIFFDGKRSVKHIPDAGEFRVEPQRRELSDKLKQIDKSYIKISKEAQSMKRRIDTAVAIAISIGGLK